MCQLHLVQYCRPGARIGLQTLDKKQILIQPELKEIDRAHKVLSLRFSKRSGLLLLGQQVLDGGTSIGDVTAEPRHSLS